MQYGVFKRLQGLKWNAFLKKRQFTENMYYNGSDNPPSRLDESKSIPLHSDLPRNPFILTTYAAKLYVHSAPCRTRSLRANCVHLGERSRVREKGNYITDVISL